jgi:hypothetical protein
MGYMHPDPADAQSCVDVNECVVLRNNVCRNGRCENMDGVFRQVIMDF